MFVCPKTNLDDGSLADGSGEVRDCASRGAKRRVNLECS